MEALITLFVLPIALISPVAGGTCVFQSELISVVQQDTTLTQSEKDRFIDKVKKMYSECFVENS